jgi:hypothetical protein
VVARNFLQGLAASSMLTVPLYLSFRVAVVFALIAPV